jgi:hypothetical protein
MSVWKATCYKDDALQAVARHLRLVDLRNDFVLSLADFDVGYSGNFSLPGSIVAGNLKAQAEKDLSVIPSVVTFATRPDPDREALGKLVNSLPSAIFGVHGVYHFIADFWHAIFKPELLPESEKRFVQNLVEFSYASSYRTARGSVDHAKTGIKTYEKNVAGPKTFIRELVKIGVRASGTSYRRDIKACAYSKDPYPEVPGPKPNWLIPYEVFWWKSVLIIRHSSSDKCYVLTRNDIDRIDKVVMGLAWMGYYLAEYAVDTPEINRKMTETFMQIKEIVRDSFSRVNKFNADRVCRAFDVLLWTYVADKTSDINRDAYLRQKKKADDDKLGEIIPLDKIRDLVAGFKLREGIELLQLYKCLPQPDFDYFGAAHRQDELYRVDKPYGEDVENEETGPYEDLWKYYKFTLLKSYHKKHGVCPGVIRSELSLDGWRQSYPYVKPEVIPFREIDDIDMDFSFRYNAHGTDILDLVKDKAICPKNVDLVRTERDLAEKDVTQKNYLMDVLSRPIPIDVQDLLRHHDNLPNDVKAEDKPEAKKPNGRWFFEASTERRLVHSEYETSVAEYGKHTVGCMMGKSTRDKITTMNYICAPDRSLGVAGYKPLLVSFDLEKFSPAMKRETHERRDKIYAGLFGQEHLNHAADVYTKGKVHYIKKNVHHSFEKHGRDFEGFSCKSNTVYHCAVMGYSIRRLRELGLVRHAGRFGGFVDDGILRLEVPIQGYDDKVKNILRVLEQIYAMANLYISWDKTYVSSYFSVFLNEFNYGGTPITPGVRSFLKISNRGENMCPSFLDDQGMLDSTVRGAIAAGCPTHLATVCHAFNMMDLFKKWGKGGEVLGTKLAIAAYAPVNLGGFSCSSVMNLSGSTSGPTLVEAIGNLRAIAVRYNKLVPQINAIVNQKMQALPGNSKVTAPMACKREGRTLKGTRAKAVIERKLLKMLNTPVIRSLIGDVDVRLDEDMIDQLVANARVPVEIGTLVYTSSISHLVTQISGKFLRARTAFKLIAPRHFFRASLANMTEARTLIHEWR